MQINKFRFFYFYAKKAKFDLVVRVKAKNEISRSRKQNVSEKNSSMFCLKDEQVRIILAYFFFKFGHRNTHLYAF